MKTTLLKFLTTGLLALLCATAGWGCRSMNQPASASFASVVIPNRSAAEIRDATVAVFREDGYAGAINGMGQLVFTKEGSRLNTISRDGLIAAQGGASTLIRVKVDLVYLDANSHRLQCHAFMVSSAGDSFFEEEHALGNIRSRPYQKLLDTVAKRLK